MKSMHYRRVCRHGTVIEQCRCPDPAKVQLLGPCPANCPKREGHMDLPGVDKGS